MRTAATFAQREGRSSGRRALCDVPAQGFAHACKDKAVMRAELEQTVRGLPLHIEELVSNTPDEHLYLSVIGDRCAGAASVHAHHASVSMHCLQLLLAGFQAADFVSLCVCASCSETPTAWCGAAAK